MLPPCLWTPLRCLLPSEREGKQASEGASRRAAPTSLQRECTVSQRKEMHQWLRRGGSKYLVTTQGGDQIWDLLLSPGYRSQRGTNIFLVESSPEALPPSPHGVSSLLSLALGCHAILFCLSFLPNKDVE